MNNKYFENSNRLNKYKIKLRRQMRSMAAAAGICLAGYSAHAQTYVTAPMTTTPAAGSYYSNTSIVLNPGFSFTAASGQSLQLFIEGPDCVPMTTSLSPNQNYILTSTPRIAGYNPSIGNYSTCDLMQTVQYFDGLGRSLQTIQIKGSPDGRDVVQPIAYDAYGREANKYLPYTATLATSGGTYKSTALTDQASFYNNPSGSTWNAPGLVQIAAVSGVTPSFAQTGFEPSPLNRVTEQSAPGQDWQLGAHTSKVIYTSNDGTQYWANQYSVNIGASGNRTLVFQNRYGANQLYVMVSRDENWISTQSDARLNTTEEYKDKQGRVVLKRTYNKNASGTVETLSTYYVYDDRGNLSFVLPPQSGADGSSGITSAANQTVLNNLCYQYNYDERNRLTQKSIPGKGWEYIVYNQLDQPVLSQDANQRATNQWTVTKYDALGRVIITGLWNAGSAIALSTLQSSIYAGAQYDARDNSGNTGSYPYGYVLSSYPTLSKVLTVNYYDSYNNIPGLPATFTTPTGASTMTQGLLTATQTAVLNTISGVNPADMLWSATYYDDLGRVIQTDKQHYLGGVVSPNNYDIITTAYNFNNLPTATTRKHYNTTNTGSPVLTIANTYTYDHVNRKRQTYESINGGTNVMLSQVDYNEIGQVTAKHLHSANGGGSFLQNIAYTYNERGWLLTSNSALFQMQLQYNKVNGIAGISPVAQYNGNIASQSWGTSAAPNTKSYTYSYDNLNRLTSGISTDNFNETGISYDLMGNITALQRTMASTTDIDNLTYTYTNSAGAYTNQVQKIVDAATDNGPHGYHPGTYSNYRYDANGNMTVMPTLMDGNAVADIDVSYNLLNLPQTISGAKSITYVYDATGDKLRRISPKTGSTDYIDGIQYDQPTTANSPTISFVQTEEGKAVYNGGSYNYTYYLGDNLGNTRITFDQTNNTTAQQTDDYYPFGYEINRSVSGTKNEYLYNKKELQEELGEYDYGARFYDPVIARWTSVDPLAEEDRRWGPYSYGFDDAMRFTDPDGMWPDDNGVISVTGNFIGGLAQSAWGTVTGAYNVVRHPINTAKALGNVVAHPINTAKAIGKAVSKGYDDFKNGDADTKANIAGNVIGDVAQLFIGAEEVKAGTETVKIAEGTNDVEKVSEAANTLEKEIPKPGKGRGSVSPAERDPKRVWTKDERADMLEKQDGKCAQCGAPKTVDEVQAHHIKRHADGGATDGANGAALCKECHVKIHQ